MVVGDVSEAADGVFFLGIIQSASHKTEINLSAAMSKIKTGSQPLYLGQHHCQPEVALLRPCPCQLLPWPWGGGEEVRACQVFLFLFIVPRAVGARRAHRDQPTPHFTDEVLFEPGLQEGSAANRKVLTFSRSGCRLPAAGYFNTKTHVLFELAPTLWVLQLEAR